MIIQGTTSKRFSAARSATLASAVAAVLLAGLANQALAADSGDGKKKDNLEEVVVTGVRASLDSAQNIKREASQVVDSIVAEDVGKLPDNNVADALARVTGVQIRRDSGEASAVLIRGLPNITTLLNGREVFTTFQRFISLADIPANMLKRVDVYKTGNADQLEGGIAGLINVETRNPFDEEGLHVHTNARGVYSDKSEKADPDVGLTVSDTWNVGVGELGALFGVSYQPRHYHEERAFNVEPDYKSGANFDPVSGAFLGFSATGGSFNAAHPAPVADFKGPFVMGNIPIAGDRRRQSLNGVLEWRPTDKSRIYAEGFSSDYKNDFELDFFVGLPFLGDGNISGTVVPGTNQMQTLTDHNVFTIDSTQANRVHTLTRQFALGGSFETDSNLKFSTDLSHTTSNFDFLNPIMDTSTIVPLVQVNTDDHGTANLSYGGPGYDIKNGRNFGIANWFDNFGHDEGKSWDWRGDVAWTADNAGIFKGWAAGLRYADRKAESIKSFGGAAYPFASTPTSSLPGLDALSEPMASGGPNYQLTQWYTPSASYLINNIARVRQQTACLYDHNATSAALFALRNDPVTCARKLDPGSFFSDKEVTKAIYVQAQLGGDFGNMPWSLIAGVRAVRTEQTLDGNSVDDRGGPVLVYTPIQADNSSNDILPSANFKLNLTPDTVARLALSRTLTRPNFPDLNPGITLSTIVSNTTGLTGASGNPDLKPVKSDNIDLAYEWYFAKAGSVTATAFGRKFDGYVQPGHVDTLIGGSNYRITRPENTGSGKLVGLEVAYQQFYDFLPSVFSGLGLQLNATFTNGKTEDPQTGEDRTITGVSKQSYNIIALYEKQMWSGRLAYNWRSKFPDTYGIASNFSSSRADLTAVPAVPGAYDLWVRATAQMDGSISFKPSDHFTLTFECINILDTEFKDYFVDQNQYPRDTRRYDRTYELGFRASF
jgi:TonB-dependent receptor